MPAERTVNASLMRTDWFQSRFVNNLGFIPNNAGGADAQQRHHHRFTFGSSARWWRNPDDRSDRAR